MLYAIAMGQIKMWQNRTCGPAAVHLAQVADNISAAAAADDDDDDNMYLQLAALLTNTASICTVNVYVLLLCNWCTLRPRSANIC